MPSITASCMLSEPLLCLIKLAAGAVIGAVAGFLYYKAVGCPSGACPITKSPYRTAVYGAVLGLMIAAS